MDLGEKGILENLIYRRFNKLPSWCSDIGNDGSVLSVPPGNVIVASTDPCPTPVVSLIKARDYYDYGWLLMTINVSDLAAMGATPLGLLSSTTMQPSMPIADYDRFLQGLSDAAVEFECPVVGGNIREGRDFAAVGTAIGCCPPDAVLNRSGARPGDLVAVVGTMGVFWAAVLSELNNLDIPNEYSDLANQAIKRPTPKIGPGVSFAKEHLVTSCIDASDGVSASLVTLSAESKTDIKVRLDDLTPHPFVEETAHKLGWDPHKLMLSWGGWELVCTVQPKQIEAVKEVCRSYNFPVKIIGEVCEGSGCLLGETTEGVFKLADLGSYRFCETSYLSEGLDSYLDFLRSEPLIQKPSS